MIGFNDGWVEFQPANGLKARRGVLLPALDYQLDN